MCVAAFSPDEAVVTPTHSTDGAGGGDCISLFTLPNGVGHVTS